MTNNSPFVFVSVQILDLQLQLDRKEGLIKALEDRVLYHEPDFSINTDEETFLYRDDLRGDHSPSTSRPPKAPSTSTPIRNFNLQVPDRDRSVADKPALKDSFVGKLCTYVNKIMEAGFDHAVILNYNPVWQALRPIVLKTTPLVRRV